MTTENQSLNRVNRIIKNSITLKIGTIGLLILILLIPSSMIKSIIEERENISLKAIDEVSSKWANKQTLNGPILTIPLVYEFQNQIQKEDSDKVDYVSFEKEELLTILPEKLNINGKVNPKKLQRGIYEIVVYESDLVFDGLFDLELSIDRTNLKEIKWDNAFITIGISDLRGIQNAVQFKIGDSDFIVKPGSKIPLVKTGITVDQIALSEFADKIVPFKFKLDLQGSQNLSFLPLGATTEVNITSPWDSPSFGGSFLPDQRNISSEGFDAQWKVLQLNRNFPQSWIGSRKNEDIISSEFGVDLILPLDDYQKSMRSAKYAVMTLSLTFLVFFLVEILNKKKIHPLQYTLVGLGLCLFYILLISISEHSNFNMAYTISSFAIVLMISLYSMSVFKNKKLSLILSGILVGIYGFVFVTLQLADYALLLGAVGLTGILGLTMYFTRNINWYTINPVSE